MNRWVKIWVVLWLLLPLNSFGCELMIFGNANKYPKVYEEQGVAKGILIDMMEYVAAKTGCQFSYRLSPWKRAYVDMLHGKGGVIGLSWTSEREQQIDYSEVMFVDTILIVTRADSQFQFAGLNDLAGKRVLYSRGASYGDQFDLAVENRLFEAIHDNGDIASRIKFVLRGRADVALVGPGHAAVENVIAMDPFLSINRSEIAILEQPLKKDNNYLGFAKGSQSAELLERINSAIRTGVESGAFQQIEAGYAQ